MTVTQAAVTVCADEKARKPHGQHRIAGTVHHCFGVGEPAPCVAKISTPGGMRECGEPTEYLTREQAAAQGHTYSGWYHIDLLLDVTHHHAVPRSWV